MMDKTITTLLITIICGIVKSEPPSTSYGTPVSPPISSYGTPNYHANDDHGHYEHGEPKAYEFGYQVKDDYTGNNYNRQETSDGNQVTGEYRVLLPDGRTQIVTYYADWQSGFHADVRYEGTPYYPEQYNNNNNNYNNGGYNAPSQQYGPPQGTYNNNNNYNYNNNNRYNSGAPATSSVHIKDYSSSSTPYNTANNQNAGYNYDNKNFDSYSGNFANKAKPSYEYGAP